MRKMMLKIIFTKAILLFVLHSLYSPLFAGQCITYGGYKRVNDGKPAPACKLKYTTLEFGVNHFCKKEQICNFSGLSSLQKSVSYRKNDIQRLQACLDEINAGKSGPKCPDYDDILADGAIYDKNLINESIASLKGEVRQLETVMQNIRQNTIRGFLQSVDNGLKLAAECINDGVSKVATAVGEAYTIVEGTNPGSTNGVPQKGTTPMEIDWTSPPVEEDRYTNYPEYGSLKLTTLDAIGAELWSIMDRFGVKDKHRPTFKIVPEILIAYGARGRHHSYVRNGRKRDGADIEISSPDLATSYHEIGHRLHQTGYIGKNMSHSTKLTSELTARMFAVWMMTEKNIPYDVDDVVGSEHRQFYDVAMEKCGGTITKCDQFQTAVKNGDVTFFDIPIRDWSVRPVPHP